MKPKPVIFVLCFNCLVCVSCTLNPACECVVYQSYGGSQGTFTSANFPQIYPSPISCTLYTFLGAIDEIVELTFLEFDLQQQHIPGPNNRCNDYIHFYLNLDRPEVSTADKYDEEICGNISMIEKKYYSSTRTLIFEFHTDSFQGNNTGFRGRFKFLNRTIFEDVGCKKMWGKCIYDCEERYDNKKNTKKLTFFSPLYPQNYPPNSKCMYRFRANVNQTIRVHFRNIQLQPISGSCSSSPDSIIVIDGEDYKSNVIAHYCNTMNSEYITSTSNKLLITFESDDHKERQGFAATFEFIDNRINPSVPSHSTLSPVIITPTPGQDIPVKDDPDSQTISKCGQTISSQRSKNGTITSPGYPRPYPSNQECQIHFQGHGKERVQLAITELDLYFTGPDPSDPYDCDQADVAKVQVNIEDEQKYLGEYCGTRLPPLLMSNGNELDVIFESQDHPLHTKRGFKATYKFVTDFGIDACKQDHTMVCGFRCNSSDQKNGTFASPNFPGLYPRNTECHFLFFGQAEEKVHIKFPYFDVEGIPAGCLEETDSDFIEFSNFNVDLPDRQMPRFCGSRDDLHKKEVESDGSFFRVTFKSNHVYDATGFEAFYQFQKHLDPLQRLKGNPNSQASKSQLSTLCIYLLSVILCIRTWL